MCRGRLIPARAGNTQFSKLVHAAELAHPRSRGEHIPNVLIGGKNEGSSPLARGTLSRPAPKPIHSGLIPARAGNTAWLPTQTASTWAHPRSRGEHIGDVDNAGTHLGSSPLARGTQHLAFVAFHWSGLIPARAGNTCWLIVHRRKPRAHPRSRGEHGDLITDRWTLQGSSPLARGTREPIVSVMAVCGLIPARAGNTYRYWWCSTRCWAHPRSRGEHTDALAKMQGGAGSSPLARGTQARVFQIAGKIGLIPARAGNTMCSTSTKRVERAHPRSRGEHCTQPSVENE